MPEHFIKVKRSEYPLYGGDHQPPINDQEGAKQGSGSNISNSNGDICRICHCEADLGNPLLSPCYCSGSLKYVHQTCLQQWLAASDTRSCELCKFNFIVHTKIKPISEWRRLEMSSIERRRLLCAILFHFVAAICVVWSLFVLIDRAAEEVQKGLIAWPFWTKLVVVAVGFTGGAVFMYIQCRQYLHLFSRWKAHNRVILVQNAPEKPLVAMPSPNFTVTVTPTRGDHQVVASVECNVPLPSSPSTALKSEKSSTFTIHEPDVESYENACDQRNNKVESRNASTDESLELNIQEILGLDVEFNGRNKSSQMGHNSKTDTGRVHNKAVFKSLPNLSASSENLLV